MPLWFLPYVISQIYNPSTLLRHFYIYIIFFSISPNTRMKILFTFMLIFCLAFFLILISILQPQHLYGSEYDVRVINGFSDNSSLPLVIWCTSEESDLGGRALQEHDDFSWRLRTNFWGTSHFICTMKWDRRRKSFEAFKVPRDLHRCSPFRRCSWLVTQEGFYFSNDEVNWKKDFAWS